MAGGRRCTRFLCSATPSPRLICLTGRLGPRQALAVTNTQTLAASTVAIWPVAEWVPPQRLRAATALVAECAAGGPLSNWPRAILEGDRRMVRSGHQMHTYLVEQVNNMVRRLGMFGGEPALWTIFDHLFYLEDDEYGIEDLRQSWRDRNAFTPTSVATLPRSPTCRFSSEGAP